MRVSRKLRNHLLNSMSEIAMDLLARHCPEVKDDTPPETWDEETRQRYDLVTDVTTAMSQRMAGKLAALSVSTPPRKPKSARQAT